MILDKDYFIIGFTRLLQGLIVFVSYRLMTHYLVAQEIGVYYLILSIIGLFSWLFINPVGVFMNRKIHAWFEKGQLGPKFSAFNLFLLASCFIAFVGTYLFQKFIVSEGYPLSLFLWIIPLTLFTQTWNNTIIPSLNMLGRRNIFIMLTLATQILTVILAVLFMIFLKKNAFYWIMGAVVAQGLLTVVAFIYFLKKIQRVSTPVISQAQVSGLKPLLRFCIPIFLTNISFWLLSQGYRPLVKSLVGLEYLGLLGLGFGFAASLATSFEYIIHQLYFPLVYKKMHLENKGERELFLQNFFQGVMPIYVQFMLFVVCAAPFIGAVFF